MRIFRLDDKLYWMKEILIAVIVSMIQLIYEYVDPDKIFFLSNSLKSTNDINFITDLHGVSSGLLNSLASIKLITAVNF